MKKEKDRKEAKEEIDKFFHNIKGNTPQDIKKMKRLAMSYNIKLGDKRKKFCKFCYSPLQGRVRISKGIKSTICKKCGKESRWKIWGGN